MSTSIVSVDSTTSNLQVEGVTALQLSSLGGVPNLNGAQIAGHRRRNLNGDMNIAQMGTSFAGTTGNSTFWTIDGYAWEQNCDGAVTVTQSLDVPSDVEFNYSLRATVTIADASIATTQYAMMNLPIEGYDVRDFINRPFTISFWVRSPKAGIHGVGLRNSGYNQCYAMSYTVNVANTWEKKTLTCPQGLNGLVGTWDWINGTGLRIHFVMAAGTTFQATPGSWVSSNILTATGQVNCMDTVNNVFAITGVQVERGTVATPFEHRTFQSELAHAQRYCFTIFPQILNAPIMQGVVWQAGSVYSVIQHPVQMRAVPLLYVSSLTDFTLWSGGQQPTSSNVGQGQGGIMVSEVFFTFTGMTPGWAAWVRAANVNTRLSLINRLP